jgi:sialic acid synthase SpsE
MQIVGEKTFIIAEMGASHCQDFNRAVSLILAAKNVGADAIKIQMFTADDMTKKGYIIPDGTWKDMDLYELYSKISLPYEWIPTLKSVAENLGLVFFTSVYHPDTVDLAEELGNPIYKVSSFELVYDDLLARIAKTGKPVILSTGMAEFTEIHHALQILRDSRKNIHLLHCISKYPAKPEDMNLRTLYDLSRYCMGRVGLSDHSKSLTVPAIAVNFGAKIIEKHLTLDDRGGYDGSYALTPLEFKFMVDCIREAEKVDGAVKYGGEKKFRRQCVEGRMIRVP